jgi:hypothetical protein
LFIPEFPYQVINTLQAPEHNQIELHLVSFEQHPPEFNPVRLAARYLLGAYFVNGGVLPCEAA